MTKWIALQMLSIQCRLFESMNVIVGRCCIETNVAISQLLQPHIMHSFYQIVNGHVYPHLIIEFL
jgi:hypothetical protein